ncbi:GNAT family N-acetyltransferase [Luteibacter anthropi]|uniref:GNAT family N-acetyltransferase n=1 Tax=Luteibacter anthropi TaxID=564369 RepID=A0A7X5U6R8_9GAMM|nr:GNAT family N-acetyltransferase [Luteibacter anthropi]NII04905.1 GNAT family N-acetyltransferase [Luteibacter anthropi]URX63714.1 GNAT family N-acetyltransferase [Luteibacter anthropi]
MSDHLIIRDANTADEAAWLALWAGYNAFYEASVAPEVTARTWQRILGTDSALTCRVADMDGTVVGFSISLLHEGTWVVEPVCYLEDLFVDPSCRGKGIGRKLIEDLVTSGKSQGWSRLYWHTRQDNPARRLYDEFVSADDFVRYSLRLR